MKYPVFFVLFFFYEKVGFEKSSCCPSKGKRLLAVQECRDTQLDVKLHSFWKIFGNERRWTQWLV